MKNVWDRTKCQDLEKMSGVKQNVRIWTNVRSQKNVNSNKKSPTKCQKSNKISRVRQYVRSGTESLRSLRTNIVETEVTEKLVEMVAIIVTEGSNVRSRTNVLIIYR